MAEWITSRTNSTIQHLRKLLASRKYRYECRAFAADGTKLVEEALRWSVRVDALVIREGLEFDAPRGIREIRVPESLMREVSRMEAPQGVLAICRMPEQPPLRPVPGCLILDGIQDPGNLGTILRTADAFGVPVLLSEGCADPYGEKTVRASMGAVFRTPPMQGTAEEILAACAEALVPLCATALSDRSRDIRQLRLSDYALVIGSEGQGVGAAYLEAAAELGIIPMEPRCESLNAAVAAAVLLWQLRQGL